MVAGECVTAIGKIDLAAAITNFWNPFGLGAALAFGIGIAYSVSSTLILNAVSTNWKNIRNWGIE